MKKENTSERTPESSLDMVGHFVLFGFLVSEWRQNLLDLWLGTTTMTFEKTLFFSQIQNASAKL